MALDELRRDHQFEIAALLTTVTEPYNRISMHGVRRELLERQAQSLGLPLEVVLIPAACTNEIYEARMEASLLRFKSRGVSRVAFGDIFLQDLREYRERNLARVGMQAIFPIWKRPTADLARDFVSRGFRAVTVCVDPRCLDESFCGCEIDAGFFARLPASVDPCGENGEFHSFVFDGPGCTDRIAVERGEITNREGFIFCDLLPSTAANQASGGAML